MRDRAMYEYSSVLVPGLFSFVPVYPLLRVVAWTRAVFHLYEYY